ncbi:MAG: hypothetical protein K2M00_04935 [Muribaculaceae bacterium]|nr:hypothetical protein [Muribaculaceae bacterium]
MKKTFLPVIALAAAAGLSSCSNNENKQDIIYSHPFNSTYAVVTDTRDGSKTVCAGVNLTMTDNWTTLKAGLAISGLKIGGSVYPMITIEKAPIKIYDTTSVGEILGDGLAFLATGARASVSDLKLYWSDRPDLSLSLNKIFPEQIYFPVLSYSFTLDNNYKIAGGITPFAMGGVTEVTAPGGAGEPYKSEEALYIVTLDFSKNLGNLIIRNVSFAQSMPRLNMEFADIPFTVDSDAVVTLASDSFIPSSGGVPQENYPISQFSATITPGDHSSTVDFVCSVHGAPFKVHAVIDGKSYKGFLNTQD